MAQLNTYWEVERLPVANPETLAQIEAPANQRILLRAIEIMPLGATGATAPIKFDVCLQTTAGTSSAGGTPELRAPVGNEAVQATMLKTFTAEPGTSTPKHSFTLHQQGARTWAPPDGPIVIEGGTRLGIRYVSATFVTVKLALYMEE